MTQTTIPNAANNSRTPNMVPLTAVDHIVFKVDDVEATVSWWRDHFGLDAERLDEWRAGDASFPWIRVNDNLIIDLWHGEADGTNVDHIAFVTDPDSFDTFVDAHTHNIEMGPAEMNGARGRGQGLYIRDPSGNRIELRTYR